MLKSARLFLKDKKRKIEVKMQKLWQNFKIWPQKCRKLKKVVKIEKAKNRDVFVTDLVKKLSHLKTNKKQM